MNPIEAYALKRITFYAYLKSQRSLPNIVARSEPALNAELQQHFTIIQIYLDLWL